MKILFLTNAYPDFEGSYRGIFIKKMATLLQKEGYDVTIVTPKIYKKSHYFEEQNGIKVYRFPFLAGDKLLIEYERIPHIRMVLYYISGFFLTIYVVLRHHCRLIHSHWAIPTGLVGVFAGAFLKKPHLVTIHGSDFRIAMDKAGVLKKIFLYVCKKANNLTCVSGEQKRKIEQMGIQGEKISLFPMGVDDAFLENEKKREHHLIEGPFIILSNRNLLPIYNVSLLIGAIPFVLKEEPDVRFLIAGEGPEKKNLEREARKLNIEAYVRFLGRLSNEEISSFLAKTDIYVSTSLYDGTSVSLLEAMASGCFPVVSDIPSNREWIRDGENGFLFPVNDEKILAQKVLDAIRNKKMVEKARKWNQSIIKEKVLWPVCIARVKKIYEDQLLRK